MSPLPVDARTLAQTAFDALGRGDARAAREAFEQVAASGRADATAWVGLAYACRSLNDAAAALAAAERALAVEPQNLRALLVKADLLASAGDASGAAGFYRFAVQSAPPPERLPPDLREELSRAATMSERYAAAFEACLRERTLGDPNAPEPTTPRFRQSLDILTGHRQIYFQQPQIYYFPELPQVQFYERGDFPWLDALEAATADIRAELVDVLRDEAAAFRPYVERVQHRPHRDLQGLDGNPSWSAFYLWKDGAVVAENAARCPRTMRAMEGVPLARVPNRSPSVLFSLLRPGARIPPHTGLVNTRLICHLPLVVPPGCRLRVGNDTRTPVEGKAWVFDDSIEHEAWNDSDRTRVILLFEIWRPELTEEERRSVCAMFAAIDAYSGRKPEWSI
jgi:hypothetical protein